MADISKIKIGSTTYNVKDASAMRDGDTIGGDSTWNGKLIGVPYGGTGANNSADARTNLGAVSGIWPLSVGGTGGTDSGWQSLTNSSVFTGTIYYRKVGAFLMLMCAGIKLAAKLAGYGNVTLGTLPTGYHPSKDIMPACFENNSNLAVRTFGSRVVGDGRIFLYSNSGAIETTNTIYLSGFGYSA